MPIRKHIRNTVDPANASSGSGERSAIRGLTAASTLAEPFSAPAPPAVSPLEERNDKSVAPAPPTKYRTLFWSFAKIGFFTFGGGYAMIPLIRREVVERRGWVAEEHFLELLTLAQTSPGSLALNAAVFVGYKVRGHRGALAATAGIVLPSLVIVLLVTTIFHQVRDNRVVAAALRGMRPAVLALIAAPVFSLIRGLGWQRLIIAAVALGLMLWLAKIWLGFSPMYFLIVGGIAGALYTFYLIRRQK